MTTQITTQQKQRWTINSMFIIGLVSLIIGLWRAFSPETALIIGGIILFTLSLLAALLPVIIRDKP